VLSVAKEAKADIWGKFEGKFGRPFYSLGFCGAQERKVVVWEDVARHTHSARQTDDSEEDEKDHFETTKKKNLETLEKHCRQSANRSTSRIQFRNHHHHHHRP